MTYSGLFCYIKVCMHIHVCMDAKCFVLFIFLCFFFPPQILKICLMMMIFSDEEDKYDFSIV